MDREPVAIPGDMTIGEALHEYFLRYRYDWFPVVDAQRPLRRHRGPRARGAHPGGPPLRIHGAERSLSAEDDNVRVSSDEPLETLLGGPPR